MKEEVIKISDGIWLHYLSTAKFKTNFVGVFAFNDLNKEDVTKNALIPAVLKRGTKNLPTMKDINIKLEELYGSLIDASIDKIGDNHVLQFYAQYILDELSLNGENINKEMIDILCDFILNPKLENGVFDTLYIEQEKEMLRNLIESKINNKGSYAINRCIEEMNKDNSYGLYKFGLIEDIDKIDSKSLYDQYKNILATSEIHIYFCGNAELSDIETQFRARFSKIDRKENLYKIKINNNFNIENYRAIIERQDVTQGKLVLGYNVSDIGSKDKSAITVYNAILGGATTSKLFQNVREKASLAYTTRSMFLKHKNIILVSAGIEIAKYEEALSLIQKQVHDMEIGEFSAQDIDDAKIFLKNLYRSYIDEQATIIDWKLSQRIINAEDDIDVINKNIDNVKKEDIIEVAAAVKLNTIYFLTGKEEA